MILRAPAPEVPAKLLEHLAKVLRAEHLAADQEEDAHRSEAGDSEHQSYRIYLYSATDLMTQEVMVIMASESEVKKSSSGLPLSPSLARETPSTIAKVIRPRMFGPLVHSPEQ